MIRLSTCWTGVVFVLVLGVAATSVSAHDPETSAPTKAAPIEVSGFVDTYYGYSFSKRDPVQLRNFDVDHSSFTISLAEIAFEKKVSANDRVGFRADLDFGPTTDIAHSFEPSSDAKEVFKHIEQAYVSLQAAATLQLDAGKFVTPLGFEVIESKDNWNYSRSVLFAVAIPYYHVGLRASLPVSTTLTLAGYAVNGWNDSKDNNHGKTFGLQTTFKPSPKLTLVGAVLYGPEQKDNDTDKRFLFDGTLNFAATPKLSLVANYDYGSDRIAGNDVSWQGICLYARFQATPVFAFTPRFEYLDDTDAFMTGTRQKPKEFTFTAEAKVAGSLLTRLEVRRDFSNRAFFDDESGSLKKDRSTLTLSAVYSFGTTF